MALDVPDYDTTREQLAAFSSNRADDLGTSPIEFMGELAGSEAQAAQSIGESIAKAAADAIPTSESTDTGRTTWAVVIGLPDGAGGYGPRVATPASGATGALTGDKGTAYLAGQLATAPGGVLVELRDAVTIPGAPPGSGQVTGTWDAVDAGTTGNLLAGTELTLVSPPAGSDPKVTLSAPMAVLGRDAEDSSAVLVRIQLKMQRPPNGGNPGDYAAWAEDARDEAGNPVTTLTLYAWVYPNYFGSMSPLIVLTAAGSGISRKPGLLIVDAVKVSINGSTTREGERPVSHDAEVFEPYMPDARALGARVRCIPSLVKYQFDWQRGTTNLFLTSFDIAGLPAWVTNAGGNAMLTLNTEAPVSFKDAITQGNEPRIQVDTIDNITPAWTGPVVPEQVRVVAFDDLAGITRLALKVSNPNTWSTWVAGGNAVYPGGPIVAKVAQAILDAVDSRGPSRVSGLYDPARLWQDTVTISTLTTAAETALDDDQLTRLVDRCITSGAAADVTNLRVGAGGTEQLTPVQAIDTGVWGPELLRLGRVLVTD